MPHSKRLKIAVAGATGFVGKALLQQLAQNFPDHDLIALSRVKRSAPPDPPGVEWRTCDLFTFSETQAALVGVGFAFYLVHSMMPSAKLSQGDFADMDLIAADNFARSAKLNGVRQIIYLGGLVPQDKHLSLHLRSRLEVEQTLTASGVPLTALRAGLVIGAGGSSFLMMQRLIERLPWLLCPRWTANQMSPIALSDVVRYLAYCVGRTEVFGRTFDVSGDTLTYREMLELTARELKLNRPMLSIRYFSPKVSRFWVSLVTGAPKSLVAPLVQSLQTPMIAGPNELAVISGIPARSFVASIRAAVEAKPASTPVAYLKSRGTPSTESREVRSVQRLPCPVQGGALFVAEEYLNWLPRALPFMLPAREQNGVCSFFVGPTRIRLLILALRTHHDPRDGLQIFDVRGGLLVRAGGKGTLEFRVALGGTCVIAAIHGYRPRLPWAIYVWTQARFHLWVMRAFGRHLRRFASPTQTTVIT